MKLSEVVESTTDFFKRYQEGRITLQELESHVLDAIAQSHDIGVEAAVAARKEEA
jgi:hypothetical protein